MVSSEKLQEYENFYRLKDFMHFKISDKIFIESLVGKFDLKNKLLLDIGSGSGYYSFLFSNEDIVTIPIELTQNGTRTARSKYKLKNCIIADALKLPFKSSLFDILFCSGFPPFNERDLNSILDIGHYFLKHLKPDGLFIFRKTSNLSNEYKNRMNHSLAVYVNYFNKINEGDILSIYMISPLSLILLRSMALTRFSSNLVKLITDITKIALRVIIIIKKGDYVK